MRRGISLCTVVVTAILTAGLAGCAAGAPTASSPSRATSTTLAAPASDAGDGALTPPAPGAQASSEDTGGGHGAAQAVDGDPATTWLTQDEGAGAVLALTWDAPADIGQVSVTGLPDDTGAVRAATLEFSDGSSVRLPELPSDGTPIVVEFAPREADAVTVRIDEVADDAEMTGIAEISFAKAADLPAAFGTPRIIADADTVVAITPRTVSRVEDTAEGRRLRIAYDVTTLAGTATPRGTWFSLTSDGEWYEPVATPDGEDPTAESDLPAPETAAGAVEIIVPTDARGLSFVCGPVEAFEVAWSLAAA